MLNVACCRLFFEKEAVIGKRIQVIWGKFLSGNFYQKKIREELWNFSNLYLVGWSAFWLSV